MQEIETTAVPESLKHTQVIKVGSYWKNPLLPLARACDHDIYRSFVLPLVPRFGNEVSGFGLHLKLVVAMRASDIYEFTQIWNTQLIVAINVGNETCQKETQKSSNISQESIITFAAAFEQDS